MPTAKAKLKSASVKASPLKRRRMSTSTGFPNAAAVAMGFKNSRNIGWAGNLNYPGNVRRIVSQYSAMEAEMAALKRRHFEQRQRARALREAMREQRAKSRQLIVSVALKLHEKEKQIQEVRPLSGNFNFKYRLPQKGLYCIL